MKLALATLLGYIAIRFGMALLSLFAIGIGFVILFAYKDATPLIAATAVVLLYWGGKVRRGQAK